jgi:FHS family glucose/mannose:H+ symporter-like MFS transporter
MSKWRLWWLTYAGFFLDGLGAVLLGPILPRLESLWGLGDGGGGALLSAQFLGMSLGTVFVLRERRRAMRLGSVLCWAGLSSIGLLVLFARHRVGPSGVIVPACAGFLLHGFGLGQVSTTLNLRAGAESVLRQSRLSFGNAMWSAGAICAPLVMSLALVGHALGLWLLALAAVFPVIWFWSLDDEAAYAGLPDKTAGTGTAVVVVTLFAGLMFLYGGAESCLSGWVTTFARRAGGAGALVSPLTTSAFWFGVAGGRALAAGLLRDWRERPALLLLVGGAAIASVGLVSSHSLAMISTWAVLAGLMLGPAFAVIVAGLLNQEASARQTGTVLAMCGFGASVMPLLLGLISERTGSLREALVLPGLCLVGMLLLVLAFVGVGGGAAAKA